MSLDYVYDMTFAEFQIRLFAYKRMQLRDWEKVRQIAWSAFIGSHQDPKKMPKTIDKFMSLDSGKPKSSVTDEQRKRFLEETEKYIKMVKNG